MLRPFPLVGASYADDVKAYDAQDCVNYLPEGAETGDARASSILRGVPGMTLVATLAGVGGGRGMRNVNNHLYVVQGTQLYSISPKLVATALGTIPGSGRVSMTHNQIAGGNQLVIVTGPLGYVWNTVDSTLTQITSDGFVGSSVTGFIDQYVIQLDPFGKYWYCSDLADALTYEPVNQFQAESDPDIIKTLIVDHSEVWAIGAKTIEQFVATGQLDVLFQVQHGTIIEMGIGGRNTAVAIDNTVYWLGSDGIVYFAAGGYLPIRVSTFAVEQDIAKLNWDNAYAFSWVDHGHKVYYITFPDGHTWGYDISQRMWHRRESYGLNFWRINHLTFWNGAWYGTDFTNGNLYRLDWDVTNDAGHPLVSRRVTPSVHNSEGRLFLSALQLYMNLGNGPLAPDSFVNLRYSDDAGATWSNWRQYSINDARNNRSRVMFRRMGTFRDRIFEIMVSADCPRDLIVGYVQMGAEG